MIVFVALHPACAMALSARRPRETTQPSLLIPAVVSVSLSSLIVFPENKPYLAIAGFRLQARLQSTALLAQYSTNIRANCI